MHFDRKNYFYPDNPKNYQITQNRTPIGRNGYIEIEVDGNKKKIEIEEMHIGKILVKCPIEEILAYWILIEQEYLFNWEIVTKPCISNSIEEWNI